MVSTLEHFAIVTYTVPPEALRPLVHPRFALDTITIADRSWALLSVVPFVDRNFRLAKLPWPRLHCGQTNYRVYVLDQHTGQRAVWFLGTVLDSWTVALPRLLWKLPWHRGRIRHACELQEGCYRRYSMRTTSSWAPAVLELEQVDTEAGDFAGFADQETALVCLTHPLRGYFWRRDGELGSYRVWHQPLCMARARCVQARFDLLDRLDLVPYEQQHCPHSVLLQQSTQFTIYLPPRQCPASP